jgi:hypothetical protein
VRIRHRHSFNFSGRGVDECLPALGLQSEGRGEGCFVSLAIQERDRLREAFGSGKRLCAVAVCPAARLAFA